MKTVKVSLFPLELIRKNIYVYLPTFLRNLGAFSIWIIFPLFLAELGASKFWIGAMYTINAGTQFLVMRRVDIAKDTKLVNAGLLLSLLVFFSYTLSKNFYHVMPIQIFLAVSYSCLYVGSLIFLTNRNEEKAACVGILNSITNVSVIFGSLLGGVISQAYGFHATMYLASSLSAIGLLISLMKQ
jgi:predicted MFS family arabinose efflux permease